jgi:hypothetical protein
MPPAFRPSAISAIADIPAEPVEFCDNELIARAKELQGFVESRLQWTRGLLEIAMALLIPICLAEAGARGWVEAGAWPASSSG